ncbi:MAG: sigma-70 family RNA polymerase sigma factor [Saprospiraceae bacterium]|nr:sigma-70 family RNA polymerase sigma factor [Saprospiraceae bacterium]
MLEKQLIEGLKNKDFKVFEELVNTHQSMVVNLCYKMTGSVEDAEDLAQEVFIKVWEKASKFRGDSTLQTWIYRVAINASLNYTRKKKFNTFFESIESIFESKGSQDNPQKELENKEQENQVQSAIQTLPENQRIALTLRTFKDHSYAEISEIMDISISSVESLIFRAKKNLKKKLANYYFAG